MSHHSQETIRGGVVVQTMLLAMRHIFDDDLEQRVPRILGLLQAVVATRTGMEALEGRNRCDTLRERWPRRLLFSEGRGTHERPTRGPPHD